MIILRVLDASGRGDFGNVEKALQWIVANATSYNIVAVNLSFGDGNGYPASTGLYGLSDELAALASQNVAVVAAAGNNYASSGSKGIAYPAADPNVVPVGAVWTTDRGPTIWRSGATDYASGTDRIVSFSQRDLAGRTVFAPGAYVSTIGTDGRVVMLSGTSAAAPQVAGAIAIAQQLALAQFGRVLTPTQIRTLIALSGTKIVDGDDEQDNVSNTGQSYTRLDLLALAEAVQSYSASTAPTQIDAIGVAPIPQTAEFVASGIGRTIVLAKGQQIDTADVGLYQSASLVGTVYEDVDRNGSKSENEHGLPGVNVFLDGNGNSKLDAGELATTTGPDGGYRILGVRPGAYSLQISLPVGYDHITTIPTAKFLFRSGDAIIHLRHRPFDARRTTTTDTSFAPHRTCSGSDF